MDCNKLPCRAAGQNRGRACTMPVASGLRQLLQCLICTAHVEHAAACGLNTGRSQGG